MQFKVARNEDQDRRITENIREFEIDRLAEKLKYKQNIVNFKYKSLTSDINSLTKDIEELKKEYKIYTEVKDILVEAGKQIYTDFIFVAEKFVTHVIKTVYNRNFEFKIKTEYKRNQNELIPVIIEDNNEFSIKEEMFGGIIDIASFALRIVLWFIEKPKSRPVFILDEPFKWTGVLAENMKEILLDICENMGFQIIMTTHEDIFKDCGNLVNLD